MLLKYLTVLVPGLSFGPLFMVIGLQPHGMTWFAYLGAIMTSVCVLVLFGILARYVPILHELEESGRLEELKEARG